MSQEIIDSSYDTMLEQLYDSLDSKKNKKLVLQNIEINTTRVKTTWSNVTTIMKSVKRDTNIFIEYLKKELNVEVTWKSNNRSEGITIFMKACRKEQLVSLLKKFITKYVICNNCKSYRTKLKKDKKTRLFNLKCYNCKTEYTVDKI